MTQFLTLLTVLCALPLCLTACGIKPDHVDPPPGMERDIFPRQYPAPVAVPVDGPHDAQ